MKITVEVEVPDFPVVPGIAAMVAPEVARFVSNQCHGHAVAVVSATEDDGEPTPEYDVDETDEDETDEHEAAPAEH